MSKTCFLVTPIGAEGTEIREHSDLMLDLFRPALEKRGYDVVRADMIPASTVITSDILRLLVEAELVIADITGRNPNVFYELGVRHSTGKPFIQVARKGEQLPFDIASIRTLFVDFSTPRTASETVAALENAIAHIEEAPDRFPSPLAAAGVDSKVFGEVLEQTSSLQVSLSAVEASIVDAVKSVERRLGSLEGAISQPRERPPQRHARSRRVFIVHGHDGELKEQVARLLEKLQFEPVILHEQADKGQTIIEKLGTNTEDIGFAFVLLTPDDVGAIKAQADSLNPRARQNVVFEHGLFVSHLGRSHVCALVKGGVEIPSDLSGVLYKEVPEKGGLEAIKFDLVQELRAAGFDADANLLLH